LTAAQREPVTRAEVIAVIAELGDRTPQDVTEKIGSLEVAWLVSQLEQRYDTTLELTDEEFEQMGTVTGAVVTLRDLLPGAGHDG
jgi:hypothetical protein